jgi:hypothetical protein
MGGNIGKIVFRPPTTSYDTSNPCPIIFIKTSLNRKIPAYFLKKKNKGI